MFRTTTQKAGGLVALLSGALLGILLLSDATALAQDKVSLLRIGTTESMTGNVSPQKEEAALDTLKGLIKDETGFNNEIVRQKDWREVADKLSKGELHLGVFQGFEFAWAQEKHAELKPLALAINVYRYPVAYVVTQSGKATKDFKKLEGQTFALPATGQGFLRLFVDQQAKASGKTIDTFFSKVTTPENVEDALDDVVDGVVGGAAIDRAALEAYKRRKPGRFSKLSEVTHSQPFPPAVIAYFGNVLDAGTLARFEKGVLEANRKEKGEMVLTLFHLTGFEKAAADFDQVLSQTRKAYPPPSVQKAK